VGPVTTGLPPRGRERTRAVVVLSATAVVLASLLVWLAVRWAARHPDQANLGDPVFEVGRAERLAGRIAEGGPFLFKDPLDRGRELYLQHLGRDAEEGWHAFEAYPPAGPRRPACLLQPTGPQRPFRSPCTGATFPADGQGLVSYPADVDDRGVVVVDLRRPR
jgi:hypothetical protein